MHIGGRSYGVQAAEATLLGCSFDAVQDLIVQRGKHCANFGTEPNAVAIVAAFLSAMFSDDEEWVDFRSLSKSEFLTAMKLGGILWAPDGDQAFDDGSYVLQFDIDDKVRLIAFKNEINSEEIYKTISDVWINSAEFYETLQKWKVSFEHSWQSMSKMVM